MRIPLRTPWREPQRTPWGDIHEDTTKNPPEGTPEDTLGTGESFMRIPLRTPWRDSQRTPWGDIHEDATKNPLEQCCVSGSPWIWNFCLDPGPELFF